MKFFIKILIIIELNLLCFSQDIFYFNPNTDLVFNKAIENYEIGNFIEARSLFNKCLFDYGNHHRLSASCLMLAKTEYQLSNYLDALITLNDFKKKFANSTYLAEAYYILGLVYFKLNKTDSAVFYLLKSYDENEDQKIIDAINYIIKKNNSILLPKDTFFRNENTQKLLLLIKNNQKIPHTDSFEIKKEDKSNENITKNSDNIQKNNKKDKSTKVYKIAVYSVPLNKKLNKIHDNLEKDYLEGIKFCIDEFNNNDSIKVSFFHITSSQDSLSLYNEIKKISNDESVIGIIGPIFSEQFIIAAKIANSFRIPIISPTATGNNIALIGEYVFQANPDFNTRAKAMAIYSTVNKNMKKFAVFAPNNSYGKITSEIFMKEVVKNGGKILGVKYYDSDPKSIQKSMLELVKQIYEKGEELFIPLIGEDGKNNFKKLINYGFKVSFLDSIKKRNSMINIYTLLGKNAKSIIEKIDLKIINKKNYEVDDPVYSIDAIYIPINSKNDIKNISASLISYKVNSKVIGTGDYNHPLDLSLNKVMNELIFDSDIFLDLNDKNFIDISRKYFEKNKRRISQYSLFAYDVAGFLLDAIVNGCEKRDQIRDYLNSKDFYDGIHSKISFRNKRINSYLNILEFKNNKIRRIYELNITD